MVARAQIVVHGRVAECALWVASDWRASAYLQVEVVPVNNGEQALLPEQPQTPL